MTHLCISEEKEHLTIENEMVMTIFSDFSVIYAGLLAILYLPQFSLLKVCTNYKRMIKKKEPVQVEKKKKAFQI